MQDLRYGWRQLKKSPMFTFTAILSLGLGIGASVTMFSAFRAVFLRSLPYRNAERVVEIERHSLANDTSGASLTDAQFLRQHGRSFEDVSWISGFETATLSRVAEPANLWVRSVPAELFPLLGSSPLLGRTLAPSDYKDGASEAVLLSYDVWEKYSHGDRGIIGREFF